MSGARFEVATGETVTAFALGPLQEREFHGPRQAMADRVDYRFVNGWVDVGDLPCRLATWEEVRTRPLPDMPAFAATEVNLPGFNRRLDFSGFWHIPHRLIRAARTRLIPPAQGDARFRIATCGGLHIWVDGQHVAAFEPFTRNTTQTMEITLPLRAAGSDVVIRLEEMAERDTNFFVELTWLGQGALACDVPGQADPEALALLMRLAQQVRPAQVCLGAGDPLRLAFDTAPGRDVTLRARVPRSVHLCHLPPLWTGEALLRGGETTADFGVPQVEDGYHALTLEFEAGDTKLTRSIAFARLEQGPRHLAPDLAPDLAGDLAARKQAALAHLAEHGEARVGRVLARMAMGHAWSPDDAAIMADTIDGIVRRRDCSDFVLVPLLWLMAEYGAALPAQTRQDARAAILGYRYWMTEPGNDAMWFWSENHVLCFHVGQYLAGRLYPDAVFPNTGKTGAQQAAKGALRLARWFDAVEQDGLAEWNSAAYYPIDFIGLLALAQLGEGRLRARAQGQLDRLFTMIALHTSGGVCAGSMGRAYDKELRAGPLTELSPFAATAFGSGWLNNGVAALPMFCLGDYAPPQGLTALARPDTVIEARYVQGHGDQGRLGLWKTPHLQLSACIDAAPGKTGHQQHLVDVQSAAAPFARVWLNHPGEDDPWGANRPSYWAGNGVMPRIGMYRDTVLYLHDAGADPRLPFSHAYAPRTEFDALAQGADFLVLVSGQGAVILKATGPLQPVSQGPGAGLEWRVLGTRTGWAVQVTALPQGGLAALRAHAAALRLTLAADPLTLTLAAPDAPQLLLDHACGLFVDGQPHPFPTPARDPQITRHAYA